jgi:hypothetical protein
MKPQIATIEDPLLHVIVVLKEKTLTQVLVLY